MPERIVLIGAGSAVFTCGLVADILEKNWECDLALVDIDPGALRVAECLTGKMIEARQAPVRLSASTERRDVLPGAAAVVCTIAVGGRRAWEKDVRIPRKYGVFQPVGDTVGPGGTSRALRMIPPMVAIAEDVVDLCPEALFFNYSNPMTSVCRAVRKTTGANLVGLCHGVPHVATYLARAVEAEPKNVRHTAVGVNHLTWFTEIRVQGRDAMPKLRETARRCREAARPEDIPDFYRDARLSWQLFELFGAFPAVLDRHVCEFFPHMFSAEGGFFGQTLGVDVFKFEDTIARGDAKFARMTEDALSAKPLPPSYFTRSSGEHEQVIDIIQSIRNDTGTVYSVNLPNCGQAPNLPAGSIIEAPAMATASGMKPVVQRPLSPGLAGTLATRLQWVETVVDAALTGDRKLVTQALFLDGACRTIRQAEGLASELLDSHRDHLPRFR
ncbi:MAG: hypothetical protein GXP31_14860 [Kiritimatiellaeota bacterium]|nr:hypothetical protein [Kiritimatiellota bacterium]